MLSPEDEKLANETIESPPVTSKNLKQKAIDIKGKQYVLVKDRIIYFNESYPKGEIITEILPSADTVVTIRACVYPGDGRRFTGHGSEKIGGAGVNSTSALENAETSAVGRALAMMGIGVIDSIASVDEINKAQVGKAPYKPVNNKYTAPTAPIGEGNKFDNWTRSEGNNKYGPWVMWKHKNGEVVFQRNKDEPKKDETFKMLEELNLQKLAGELL